MYVDSATLALCTGLKTSEKYCLLRAKRVYESEFPSSKDPRFLPQGRRLVCKVLQSQNRIQAVRQTRSKLVLWPLPRWPFKFSRTALERLLHPSDCSHILKTTFCLSAATPIRLPRTLPPEIVLADLSSRHSSSASAQTSGGSCSNRSLKWHANTPPSHRSEAFPTQRKSELWLRVSVVSAPSLLGRARTPPSGGQLTTLSLSSPFPHASAPGLSQ